MSTGMQFFVATIFVYLIVDIVACMALNLQFGVAGILNFSFILFQAVGAYAVGIFTLGPDTGNGGFQHYIIGWSVPFPIAIILAGAVGAILAVPVGWIALRKLRSDLQAVVLLVVAIIASTIVSNDTPLLNGSAGLALIPKPFEGSVNLSVAGYNWFYVGVASIILLIIVGLIWRLSRSPLWRAFRAVRENEFAAAALGRSVFRLRMLAMVIGGGMAAVSGAILAAYIGIWSPGAWGYPETVVYLGAVILGGSGNMTGAAIGAAVLPVGLLEATQFLPNIGPPGFIDAVDWIVTGILIIGVIYLWPQGILPERVQKFARRRTDVEVLAPVDEVRVTGGPV